MGLKHAIHTLVRRDASPAHETKAGPAAKSNNESFKSIRNFVYVFVHRNDSAAVEENDTEQDALTHRDLRRFPGGYQLVNFGNDDEPRPVSQPDLSSTAFRNGNKVKERYLWEVPEEDYELHEVEFRARERKKPISW
ncbi:hypothetical protein LA080_013994 [Diaporthe eres]|uniref:Uncharacterized protein n=1 Tax=Diaporthe vaccinii TaxID=105482 RepID=A0ABR4EWZ8_9PEZI|nr:hypothetical protein LA080_013994 [Diaporthe eres]